jgi:hypothetical protein
VARGRQALPERLPDRSRADHADLHRGDFILTERYSSSQNEWMQSPSRGPFLSAASVLFGVLALYNLAKPVLLTGGNWGYVFLGKRLDGAPEWIAAWAFAGVVAVYAVGIWRLRRYALWIGGVYATYVVVNLVAFKVRYGSLGPSWMGVLAFIGVAVGVSSGTAFALYRRRAELEPGFP